jgi:hypothetical protein
MTFSAVEIQIVPSRLSLELVKGTAISTRDLLAILEKDSLYPAACCVVGIWHFRVIGSLIL